MEKKLTSQEEKEKMITLGWQEVKREGIQVLVMSMPPPIADKPKRRWVERIENGKLIYVLEEIKETRD